MAVETSPPSTREVADALGADPDQLLTFVEYHHTATVANVLGAFEGDPEDAELVEKWLSARRGGEA